MNLASHWKLLQLLEDITTMTLQSPLVGIPSHCETPQVDVDLHFTDMVPVFPFIYQFVDNDGKLRHNNKT